MGRVIKEDILEILVPDTFRMLNTPPIGDNSSNYFQKVKETWQQTHSRNIGLLIESYQRLEPGRFLIDGESEYAEWTGKCKTGDTNIDGKFYGMRHRETHKPHGLVRFVSDVDGWIREATFKQGELHGLRIWYYDDWVQVYLYKDGSSQGYFSFDREFKETRRDGYVHELTPAHFNPAV